MGQRQPGQVLLNKMIESNEQRTTAVEKLVPVWSSPAGIERPSVTRGAFRIIDIFGGVRALTYEFNSFRKSRIMAREGNHSK
jgi:hypothetical protein